MSNDDNDDDYVVPSGSRRSSFVPPAESGEYIPALPDVPEQDAPTSSTGQVPTIGAAGDEPIAQTPAFAESVEIPVVEPESFGSIVIEVPAEEPAEEPADEPAEVPVAEAVDAVESRDQFGLPLVGDPIDIPQVVLTDSLPEAVSGTGTDTVFDDNRMFPPIVTAVDGENSLPDFDEVVEDPIIEEFGRPAESPVTNSPEAGGIDGAPVSLPELPSRASLTPEQLSEVLSANGGMSSNDQMALLDAQIPLREADTNAVRAFMDVLAGAPVEQANDLMSEAQRRFGDLAPELFASVERPVTDGPEFTDDSTPITGIPVIEHVEIVEVVEDESGEVVAVSVTDIDEISVPVATESTNSTVEAANVPADEQAWSLTAPAEVLSDDRPAVERRSWWTLTSVIASLIAVTTAAIGAVVFTTGSAPHILFLLAGLVAATPLVLVARLGAARTGTSWRSQLEELLGRTSGRIAAGLLAVLTLVVTAQTLFASTNGLGVQLESSSIGTLLDGVVPAGATGPVLAALALLAGAVIAALPHRLFRAKSLVLAGWTAVGTGSLVAMGVALLASSTSESNLTFTGSVNAGGLVAASVLLVGTAMVFGFQEVSRVREKATGILWISIGIGLGVATLAGIVVSALLTPEAAHFFFGLNPVLHIIAPSGILNLALGALAFVPAVVLTSALVFRFVGVASTRDDRENPNALVTWLLALVPVGFVVLAFVGVVPTVVENLPSVTAVATLASPLFGILAAQSVLGHVAPSKAVRRVLVAVALVTATLGLGFASSDGVLFTWIGFINNALNPLGLGLLYVNAIAALGTALVAFLVAVVVLSIGARRSPRVA